LKPLRIAREAAAELEEAAAWYEARRSGLGDELVVAVEAVFARIEERPASGAVVPGAQDPDVRRIGVRRFPYHVVFLDLQDRVQVLAIAHRRRQPFYWRDRADKP
jgi:plasmid stabilization system protein ParE